MSLVCHCDYPTTRPNYILTTETTATGEEYDASINGPMHSKHIMTEVPQLTAVNELTH